MDLPSDPDQLISVEQLAEALGVPAKSVRVWGYRGEGPKRMKIGRHVRYRVGDVREWLEARYVD